MRRVIQMFSGVLVFLAFVFSWLFALTYFNRVRIDRSRANYRPETFVVTGAKYDRGGDEAGATIWWLEGTVNGRPERLGPDVGAMTPRSSDDLLQIFPKDTRIPVLYNPNETDTLIQGESLRVQQALPNFWEREDALRRKLAAFVWIPVPAALALYGTVRVLNRRRRLDPEAGPKI